MEALDAARLSLNQDSIWILNGCIALIMFGVAIDLRVSDFIRIFRNPKAPVVGLLAQFFVMPAVTFVATLILQPQPSLALGMILIAACPGGNLSNFLTYYAKGNAALSITMSAVSTAAALLMTPFNLTFWGMRNPATAAIMNEVHLDPADIFNTIMLILGIPLVLGMAMNYRWPQVTDKLHKPFKYFSTFFFIALVGMITYANWGPFTAHLPRVIPLVVLHNALALTVGYVMARIARLDEPDRRAVTIEVGIQNSALGLTLVFLFFDGMGGMALLAGLWGIWHIIAGLTLGTYWTRHPPKDTATTEEVTTP